MSCNLILASCGIGKWLGDRVQIRKQTTAGFLLPQPPLCRPDGQRWGPRSSVLAPYLPSGAKLCPDSEESCQGRDGAIQQISAGQLDLGRCGLVEGSGFHRDGHQGHWTDHDPATSGQGKSGGCQASQALEQEEGEGGSNLLRHKLIKYDDDHPRGQLHRCPPLPSSTCSEQQGWTLPASVGRGGSRGKADKDAEWEASHPIRESQEQPQRRRQADDLMPDFGVLPEGTFLPEGIRCTEFFKAAMRVASSQGPFAAFFHRSMVPIRADARPRHRSDLWPCPPPCWGCWTPLEKLSPKRRRKPCSIWW